MKNNLLAVALFACVFAIFTIVLVGCTTTKTTVGTYVDAAGVSHTITNTVVSVPGVVTNAYLGTNGVVTQLVYAGLQIGAQQGAIYAIQKDPASKAYFQAAVVAIEVVIASGNYSSANLTAALNGVTIKGVSNADIQLAVTDILTLYKGTEAQVLTQKLDSVAYLQPALTDIVAGLNSALAYTPTIAPVTVPASLSTTNL